MFKDNKNKNEEFEEASRGKKEQKELNNQEEKKEEKEEKEEKKEAKQEENSREKQLEEENKKLKDSLMRTLAELENTRRIAGEEKEKTAKFAIGKFAEDLIPVMEDFYLAFKNSENKENANEIFFDGIKLTHNELKKVFERNGLVRIFPVDEVFNPELHNAISQIESDKEEGTIVDVMQAGYTIKGRLLRPALVIVSKGKKE